MGFRVNLLPYTDALYYCRNEVKSEFYGEIYAEKYRDSKIVMDSRYPDHNGNFKVHMGRVFMKYEGYKWLVGKSKVHLHDSIITGWIGDQNHSPYFSHKIFDALYSSTIPVTTPFLWMDNIIQNKEIRNLITVSPDIQENIKKIVLLNSLDPVALTQVFTQIRNDIEAYYSIHRWGPVFKKFLGI
jgi:hypothetical protein